MAHETVKAPQVLLALFALGCAAGAPPFALDGSADAGVTDTSVPFVDATGGPEICGNGLDDDRNGRTDEDCECTPGAVRPCYASGGTAEQAGRGPCLAGSQSCTGEGEFGMWSVCAGAVGPSPEVCADGIDNDCSGGIDDASGCVCTANQSRACYTGDPTTRMIGICHDGTETCDATGSAFGPCTGEALPFAEICNNGVDENCNGTADDGCAPIIEVPVNINGDCVTASCPASAPYPVGCNIVMEGDDTRGCVANDPMSSVVYFKEGNVCGIFGGNVSGTLRCSTVPGPGLDAVNCPMNKRDALYPRSSAGCPS